MSALPLPEDRPFEPVLYRWRSHGSAVVRLNANLFQPSFKLQEKTRIGARVIKRYDLPVPPAARVLAHPKLVEADKERLRAIMETA